MPDRVSKRTIGICRTKRNEWYKALTGGIPVAVSRFKKVIAPQQEVHQGREIAHLIQLDEKNSMVEGSKLWHACNILHQTLCRYLPGEQKSKLDNSSTASGRLGSGGGPFESAGRDESNGIRLELVACL